MNTDHYPGIRLKQLLGEAGLLPQFDEAIRAKSYAKMKEFIGRVTITWDLFEGEWWFKPTISA